MARNRSPHLTAEDDAARRRLVDLLNAVATREGSHPTSIPGVELWRASRAYPRHPVVYQPKVVFVAQAMKRGFLGGRVYQYDADSYLVLSVPLPFECETLASPSQPLLGITVAVDPTALAEMLVEMDEPLPTSSDEVPLGLYSTPITADLRDAVIRLVSCLRSPTDSLMLGPQTAREIVYRVLRGEQGGALRALANRDEQFVRIARVLRSLHADFARAYSTDEMARQAGMSVSVFHGHFKAVTATSPLQYLKRLRLHRARTLMAYDGHTAGTAAAEVGYESPSQFGREFKRLFGASPAEDAAGLRARLANDASPVTPPPVAPARPMVEAI